MATMLEQQQLLEPAPTRSLIVPIGHSAYWGVDPSSVRVAIAGIAPSSSLDGPERWVETHSFARAEGAQRLSEIYAVTRRAVIAAADVIGRPWPGLVWVEQPAGNQRNWSLYYAVGVIMAAVWDGLYDVTGKPVRIAMVTPSRWKLLACGRGSIRKPKPGDKTEYDVLRWARLNGYEGSSWDEADAWAIAEAARREVSLLER